MIDFQNIRRLFLLLCLVTASSLACSFFDRFTKQNKQSDKVNSFNYSVPFGLAGAEPDPEANSDSRFVIVFELAARNPDRIDLKIGSIDSPKVDLAGIANGLRRFAATRQLDGAVAYIAAEAEIPQDEIGKVIDVIREQGFTTVRFLVSSFERFEQSQARKSNREEWVFPDVPAPDSIFEIELQRSRPTNEKPNPLMLFVATDRGMPILNNERSNENQALTRKLIDIFRQREENGVFRENSNEIEKTVCVDIEDRNSDYAAQTQKYGDIVRFIDSLKLAGSSPIILGYPADGPERIDLYDPSLSKQSTDSKVPKTISGGVLNSKATSLPKPQYPPAAKAVRASGAVSVQVTVDENGNVIEAKAVSGHPLLKSAAEQAARSAKFSPTLLSGQRVKVTGVITYNFAPESQQ